MNAINNSIAKCMYHTLHVWLDRSIHSIATTVQDVLKNCENEEINRDYNKKGKK